MPDVHEVAFHAHTRLTGFDYRSSYAYFVTVCVSHRECVFGRVEDDIVVLSRRGLVARDCWIKIPEHNPHVELGDFVSMPNHVHGVLLFVGDAPGAPPVVATHASRSTRSVEVPSLATGPDRGSLGAVIGSYKAAVSRMINKLRPGAATNLWQLNYYDHVIRSDRAQQRISDYIRQNPSRWARDRDNPDGDGTDDVEAFIRSLVQEDDSPLRGERDAGVATTGGVRRPGGPDHA